MVEGPPPKTYVTQLAKDLQILEEASSNMAYQFGQLGSSGNKAWTVFARAASGSFWWRLQARLRVVSNLFELYTDSQRKQNKEMLESIDLQIKFADAAGGVKKKMGELTNIQKALAKVGISADTDFSTIPDSVEEKLLKKLKGTDELFDKLIANKEKALPAFFKVLGMYADAQDSFEKEERRGTQTFIEFHKENLAKMGETLATSVGSWADNLGKKNDFLKKLGGDFKGAAGFLNTMLNPFKRRGDSADESKGESKDDILFNPSSIFAKTGKLLGGFVKSLSLLPKLVKLGLSALGTAMLWGTSVLIGLLVVFAIIKKAWPVFKLVFKGLNDKFKIVETLLWGLREIFEGVVTVLQGLWEGDLVKVLNGLWEQIMPGILAVGLSLIGLIVSAMTSLATALIAGIVGGLGQIWSKLWNLGDIPWFASGGVSTGGMAVVGEKGPELVSLPKGSRVHSNADSKTMGGNTIHVHVNGRVGASDAEIRDIANKVAREINLRMNRTGTATMGV